ncbi:Predicted membrane protein [Phaffia rhodozyma]|uniref:Predicted membrane protein n=1 Tax=Phaffia rhodozyma TaxID=264483 RepID=A0A0F7SMB0_PHARH|nr:Predicted membrane protein [Phaffia rhodozyma]
MSSHPANTLSGLCFVGGIIGFSRTRSIPSIVGGFALGSLFAISGMRIQEGLDYGYETAAASSVLLMLAGLPRFRRGRVPQVLTGLGLAGTGYYGKTLYDFSR